MDGKLGFKSGPVTFRYRSNKGQVTVEGVFSVSGEVPAYSDTFYVIFYDENKKQIGRCAESRLLGDGKEKYYELFGRSYWNKIYAPGTIELDSYESQFDDEIGGLPHDTTRVWAITNIPEGQKWGCPSKRDWLIEHTRGATLHIFNNKEVTREAPSFREALRLLFPDHRIIIRTRRITCYEEEV